MTLPANRPDAGAALSRRAEFDQRSHRAGQRLSAATIAASSAATNKITSATNTADEILENQGAECLYMVVMNACGDGEVAHALSREQHRRHRRRRRPRVPRRLGPSDRVPPLGARLRVGHPDQRRTSSTTAVPTSGQAWTTAGSADHDPFDLYRAHPSAFRLVPLIYSAGRDEEAGLHQRPKYRTWRWNVSPTITVNTNFDSRPASCDAAVESLRQAAARFILSQYLGIDTTTSRPPTTSTII